MEIEKALELDERKMEQGVWFVLYGDSLSAEPLPDKEEEADPPARFLIVSSDSPEIERLSRKYQLRHRGAIAAGGVAQIDALHEVACRVVSEGVVKDWRNITRGGEPVPCTKDEIYKIVKRRPGGLRLRREIERAAASSEPFNLDEEARKNS